MWILPEMRGTTGVLGGIWTTLGAKYNKVLSILLPAKAPFANRDREKGHRNFELGAWHMSFQVISA